MTKQQKALSDLGISMARNGMIGIDIDRAIVQAGFSRKQHTAIRQAFNAEVERIYTAPGGWDRV